MSEEPPKEPGSESEGATIINIPSQQPESATLIDFQEEVLNTKETPPDFSGYTDGRKLVKDLKAYLERGGTIGDFDKERSVLALADVAKTVDTRDWESVDQIPEALGLRVAVDAIIKLEREKYLRQSEAHEATSVNFKALINDERYRKHEAGESIERIDTLRRDLKKEAISTRESQDAPDSLSFDGIDSWSQLQLAIREYYDREQKLAEQENRPMRLITNGKKQAYPNDEFLIRLIKKAIETDTKDAWDVITSKHGLKAAALRAAPSYRDAVARWNSDKAEPEQPPKKWWQIWK